MNYPLMLYRSSLDDWRIADDAEHEQKLLKNGYHKHADFVAKDTNKNDTLDIDEMTKADIMQNLDVLNVSYSNRDSKDKLAALLFESLDSE